MPGQPQPLPRGVRSLESKYTPPFTRDSCTSSINRCHNPNKVQRVRRCQDGQRVHPLNPRMKVTSMCMSSSTAPAADTRLGRGLEVSTEPTLLHSCASPSVSPPALCAWPGACSSGCRSQFDGHAHLLTASRHIHCTLSLRCIFASSRVLHLLLDLEPSPARGSARVAPSWCMLVSCRVCPVAAFLRL